MNFMEQGPPFADFTQLDKKFPTIYLNKNFVTMFT